MVNIGIGRVQVCPCTYVHVIHKVCGYRGVHHCLSQPISGIHVLSQL